MNGSLPVPTRLTPAVKRPLTATPINLAQRLACPETLTMPLAVLLGLVAGVAGTVSLQAVAPDLRAMAAWLALAAFVYPAQAWMSGSLSALIGSIAAVFGFNALAQGALQLGTPLLQMGFSLHILAGLLVLTLMRSRAGWRQALFWIGLNLGVSLILPV